MLSMTKAIFNVDLTTTPVAISLPTGISGDVCVIVATLNDEPVAWRRQEAADSAVSIYYAAGHLVRGFKLQEGATLFYAKTITGTATLEIEVLS